MAKQQPGLRRLGDFEIIHPQTNEAVPLLADNTIAVEIRDSGAHDEFRALVYSICRTTVPSLAECTDSVNDGAGATKTGRVRVFFLDAFDILEDHKQIVVYGVLGDAVPHTKRFRIVRTGSASAVGVLSGSQGRCGFCSTERPVPVALRLTHAGGIVNGTCGNCAVLNQPALLLHSNDGCFNCCWFSSPIAFCGVNPGFWKLQKTDARTWELTLNQVGADDVIAQYTATVANNECRFPLTLSRGTVGKECASWPAQIVINAAP